MEGRCGEEMANEKNLKPFTSDQSREEAKKNGRKGGIASGKAKRKKKDLRQAMEEALNGTYKVKTKEGEEQEMTGAEMLVASMMQIATNSKSRSAVAAFNTILKMTGQDTPAHDDNDDDQVKAFLKAMRGDEDD